MNYASLRKYDIANGEGIRVSLFVSGCRHCCKGCFNEEAQAFDYGEPFTCEVEDEIIEAMKPAHIAGLTLLGGEPMEPENQRAIVPFLRRAFKRDDLQGKTLWVYTGCTLEELKNEDNFYRTEVTDEFLDMVDVLVDGPFVEELKDISLQFRGSSNQRILRLKGNVPSNR
jgi:anaerobic ribonucleoside-triphosphate reductase activating protein